MATLYLADGLLKLIRPRFGVAYFTPTDLYALLCPTGGALEFRRLRDGRTLITNADGAALSLPFNREGQRAAKLGGLDRADVRGSALACRDDELHRKQRAG